MKPGCMLWVTHKSKNWCWWWNNPTMIAIMIESRLISNILQDYFIIFPMFFQLQSSGHCLLCIIISFAKHVFFLWFASKLTCCVISVKIESCVCLSWLWKTCTVEDGGYGKPLTRIITNTQQHKMPRRAEKSWIIC